jgi:hypothetical protein
MGYLENKTRDFTVFDLSLGDFHVSFWGDKKREVLSTDVGHDGFLQPRTYLPPDKYPRDLQTFVTLLWCDKIILVCY